jgi:hypothetical protein
MNVQGKWRIVAMPGYQIGHPDMAKPADILFDKFGGEFAFDVSQMEICAGDFADFTWPGADEMDEAYGYGLAEISRRPDMLTQWRRSRLHHPPSAVLNTIPIR